MFAALGCACECCLTTQMKGAVMRNPRLAVGGAVGREADSACRWAADGGGVP